MIMSKEVKYTEEEIRSLDWKEHIRMRPGMYIGKLGDGSAADDGIYILLKEIIDNSIDEHVMGHGRVIDITLEEDFVTVRDYGRGIPLGKVIDCVSKINTGGKYDSKAFQKSVGLNGVGTKAVNALSTFFKVQSVREGRTKIAEFQRGELLKDHKEGSTTFENGTIITFKPDESVFKNFNYRDEYIDEMLWNYAYLNTGLKIRFNGKEFFSANGLLDMLQHKVNSENLRYPIVHFKDKDIELAFTHENHYGEDYYTFVNGQNTIQGGTHLLAFREAMVKTVRDFYKKDFDATDIRASIIAALSIRIQEPVFESQTKTKLGSMHTYEGGPTLRSFIGEFVENHLNNFLHRNPEIAEAMLKRIMQSEKERKEMAGIRKLANERAKKASLHNKKLRDCKVHFNDLKNSSRYETTLFITEGDSASGSITKSRSPETQAVFSLRGKPLNTFGLSKKIVYENEEFNLLQHALDIEDGLDSLRYNKIVLATDADVDGMHIRLLMLTFFLRFFPELAKNGHLYILETPLFRVRNKQKTIYCYSDEARVKAINLLGGRPEITRFKGLGEISPEEFGLFIGEDIRLTPVKLNQDTSIEQVLEYYMGKNTPDRQQFIIENLKVEKDEAEIISAEAEA